MNVEEIMSAPAVCCGVDDTLDVPARMMWEADCGTVPVVNKDGQLCGVVTDRDICMATYLRGKRPHDISVADTMATQVTSCAAKDSLQSVERRMSEQQIRRAPVVDSESRPIGVVSLSDIARRLAEAPKNDGLDRELVQTMAAICKPARAAAPLAG